MLNSFAWWRKIRSCDAGTIVLLMRSHGVVHLASNDADFDRVHGILRCSPTLRVIARNLRVLNGISHLKENERVLRDLGMEGLVNKMDLTELQN